MEGLIYGGKFGFNIDWATLINGRKFTVFALFYFVFEGNFEVQAPPGGLYLEGRFNGGFFALRVWGLIFGGAYTWRDLFSEFYGITFFTFSVTFFNSKMAEYALELSLP